MIEAGLAVIAACLPTLQYLIRKKGIEKMTSNMRSIFSSNAAYSKASELTPIGPYTRVQSSSAAVSVAPMVGRGTPLRESIDCGNGAMATKGDGIYDIKQVSQRKDLV